MIMNLEPVARAGNYRIDMNIIHQCGAHHMVIIMSAQVVAYPEIVKTWMTEFPLFYKLFHNIFEHFIIDITGLT